MKFAVTIISPPDFIHSAAFHEVAETLHYGLIALGHDSILTTQGNIAGRKHIILGPNLLSQYQVPLADDAILYNLEQVQEGSRWFTPSYLDLLRRYEVWDYSQQNAERLGQLGVNISAVVPVGYSPELTRITHVTEPDIDVLFFGSINPRRQTTIDQMRELGLRVEVLSGVYGAERDAMIARARLVLNLHYYEAKVLEMVRIAYLLANRCAVLSEYSSDIIEDLELAEGVAFARYEDLPHVALQLVASKDERVRLAENGFLLIQSRPVTIYLKAALEKILAFDKSDQKNKQYVMELPKKLNFGSGKSRKEEMFNIDILPERGPDLVLDLSHAFPFDQLLLTERFGEISISRGYFDYILADNVLEHIPDLITAMTNCLDLLSVGGILEIIVPYDLSYGAWQDPTHVRAFNERSWLYYTEWCWYVGWTDYRFDLIEQKYTINEYGSELMHQLNDITKVARFPRAVDALQVKLRKRATTPEEKLTYQASIKGPLSSEYK